MHTILLDEAINVIDDVGYVYHKGYKVYNIEMFKGHMLYTIGAGIRMFDVITSAYNLMDDKGLLVKRFPYYNTENISKYKIYNEQCDDISSTKLGIYSNSSYHDTVESLLLNAYQLITNNDLFDIVPDYSFTTKFTNTPDNIKPFIFSLYKSFYEIDSSMIEKDVLIGKISNKLAKGNYQITYDDAEVYSIGCKVDKKGVVSYLIEINTGYIPVNRDKLNKIVFNEIKPTSLGNLIK